jgi:23S rRNA (adenine2030-N6)-methyltransferase
MGHYDHRVHAGNAGDVWKHFLLLEAANYLLDSDSSLVYAESHVDAPGMP